MYKTYNNDVSWEIDGKLIVLVEHQSTINENMPFRCLEYVTRIYEGIFPQRKRYAEKVFKIPNPDFYVVYIGKDNYPLEKELKLSDAFYEKDGSKLELVVKVKIDELKIAIAIFLTLFNSSQAASGLTQVINMLCAKYDYKMDIAVKQEEAFEDGKEAGLAEGAQQKAIEAAKTMLLKNYPTNDISEITGLPIEKVLELQKAF